MKVHKEVINFIKDYEIIEGIYYLGNIYFKKTSTTEVEIVNSIPDEVHPIEKAYLVAKQSLNKLTDLLQKTENYSWDSSRIVSDGSGGEKVLNIKGTAPQILKYNKELAVVIKNFSIIEEEYLKYKEKSKQTKGGQTITKGQKIDW